MAGACVPGWIFPQVRLWAVHHFAFLPFWLSLILLISAVILLLPFGARCLRFISRFLSRLSNRPAFLWAFAALIVFFVFRVSVPILGDGPLWISELMWVGEFETEEKDYPRDRLTKRKEPLELALHEAVFRAASLVRPPVFPGRTAEEKLDASLERQRWFREAAYWTYAGLSMAAGAALVWLLIVFARRRINPAARAPFLLIFASGGSILLFFGYVENYTWISLCMLACLAAGVEESFPPRRFPWKTVLCFVIALGFHYTAFLLLPSVLYLLVNLHFQPQDEAKKRLRAPVKRLYWLAPALGIAGLIGYVWVRGWEGWVSVIPLLPRWSSDGYALLSTAHFIDLLNIFALGSFLAIVIGCAVKSAADTSLREQTTQGFLKLATGCGIVFVLVFNPNLGMARDWDILCVALWPLLFFAAWKAAGVDSGAGRHELLALLTAFLLLIPVPYVLVNALNKPSIERFETLLAMDRSRSGYGWENLALHYQRIGDLENRTRAWGRAVEVDSNPRYKVNLANALRMSGQLDEALSFYVEAARQNPDLASFILLLAQGYANMGGLKKAGELAALTRELDPDNEKARILHEKFTAAREIRETAKAGDLEGARNIALRQLEAYPDDEFWKEQFTRLDQVIAKKDSGGR